MRLQVDVITKSRPKLWQNSQPGEGIVGVAPAKFVGGTRRDRAGPLPSGYCRSARTLGHQHGRVHCWGIALSGKDSL